MSRADRPFRLTITRRPGWGMLAALVLASGAVLAHEVPQATSDKAPSKRVQKDDQTADPNLAVRVKDYVSRQLWKSRIAALPAEPDRSGPDDLEHLMERLKAAEAKARPKDRAADTARPAPAPDPNAAKAVQTEPVAVPTPAPKSPTPDAERGARVVAGMPEALDPNAVTDPLKMAEILYASGLVAKAAPFYQKALALSEPEDKRQAAQRQWILLQLGRCWREDQPAQARQAFSQLISEYPDSPWIEVARVWQGLTDWYLTEQPRQAIGRMTSATPQASEKPQPAAQP